MGKLFAAATLFLLAAVFTAGVSAADVQVQLLRGETLKGELTAVSAEKVTIAASGNDQTLPGPEVLAVEFTEAKDEAEKPRVWIELLDGSRLHAASISLAAGKATIDLPGGDRLTEVPARAIRAIRLNPEDPQLASAWLETLAGKRGGDVLVLRKTATRTVEENNQQKTTTVVSLDELEGTVLQISDAGVKFDFDGDKVDVKREKLEGIIFFQPVKRELPPASLRLFDVADSEWRLRTLELKDGQLVATTPAGVTLQLSLARVKRLDFSAGNVAMLAQLPMEASEATSALLPKGLSNAALDWFEPAAGKRPGRPTKGPATSSSAVSLTGKSLATYRTPEGFHWFRAGLVLAGKQGTGSDVEVVILGDGKPLAKQQLLATAERKPIQIEADISGVRRVTLQTLPIGGQGLGALVDFQDARFTK